jgi:hypothetical protein
VHESLFVNAKLAFYQLYNGENKFLFHELDFDTSSEL